MLCTCSREMRLISAASSACLPPLSHTLAAEPEPPPPRSSPACRADSLTTPIVQTATYTFQDTAELIAYQEGRYGSYEYGRYGNPTTRAAEEKIRELEGAEDCLVSSSGMNAATTMLLALVPAGGHIVTTTDCYRRTRQFIQTVLPKMGITATVIDPADLPALERALEEHTVRGCREVRCREVRCREEEGGEAVSCRPIGTVLLVGAPGPWELSAGSGGSSLPRQTLPLT